METRKQANVSGSGATLTPDAEPQPARKLNFAENMILTFKVLATLGLIGGAIWGIDVWTMAK